jgi:hypothetical protein
MLIQLPLPVAQPLCQSALIDVSICSEAEPIYETSCRRKKTGHYGLLYTYLTVKVA